MKNRWELFYICAIRPKLVILSPMTFRIYSVYKSAFKLIHQSLRRGHIAQMQKEKFMIVEVPHR